MYSTSTKWYRVNYGLVVWLILIVSSPAFSQLEQSIRFEVPLSGSELNFDVIATGDDGLFLQRRLSLPDGDQMEIARLDTGLHTVWRGYLPLDKQAMHMGSRTDHGYLYLLFRDPAVKDFSLYAIDKQQGNFVRYSIKNIIPFIPSEFQIAPQAAIIGGYFNRIPVVIYFPFIGQKTKVLPGLLNENGELTQIKAYTDGSFDVLISARNMQGLQTIWIKNYDAEGNILRNMALEPEGTKHLIFARSVKTDNAMQIVAGVYGSRNSDYSKGLFIASIDPSGLQHLKYYNYGDLKNFFKYMKVRREQRVRDRISRRKIKGKKIRFNYRFMVHEILPYNGQYVLLGEAFYPKYVTVDRANYGGFFSPYSFGRGTMIRDGRVFDGYHYTHAVVMGFDTDGKLMWDNSFEINDVKTFTLEQFVKIQPQPDKIALLYMYENQLRTKIIQNDSVLEGKTSEPLKTRSETEIARMEKNNTGKLEYWYGNYFFAWGVQEIMSLGLGKRRVFFINKISYR